MENGYKVWGKDVETYLENMEDGYKVWGKDGEYRDEKPTCRIWKMDTKCEVEDGEYRDAEPYLKNMEDG